MEDKVSEYNAEEVAREYVEKRFQKASQKERDKIIKDWTTKDVQSDGIACDFEERVGPIKGLTVLDDGSGNGGISIAFSKKGATVHGVDVEEELVHIAKKSALAAGVSADFKWYEGATLPFSENMFDAVVSVSVIEHVTDPVKYFSEILRVLKPTGVLYLAFPNKLNPKETHTGLWGLSYLPRPLGDLYTSIAKRNPIEENNLHFYTFWDMQKMLHAASTEQRSFSLQKEKGSSTSFLKNAIKRMLRPFGIPHQALLPHVMLVLKKSECRSEH